MPRNDRHHQLSDLVYDSKIETIVNGTCTEHAYHEPGRSLHERNRRRIERWDREGTLGKGSFGVVYQERCRGSDKVRAVKEISKSLAVGEQLDYYRELEAITKFSNHKYSHCFVRSDGWYESKDSIFIVMEYMELGDLQKYLTRPFPEAEVQQIIGQLLEGLDFMHSSDFVHRDLKPSNVMVVDKGPDWYVKITDFGISKRRQQGVTTLHTMQRGSLGFAAPEVLGLDLGKPGGSYSFAVDMWSLGVLTFYLLTNSMVFSNYGETFMYATGVGSLPVEKMTLQKVSDNAQQFVISLLAPTPSDRPTASGAVEHAWLATLLTSDPTSLEDLEWKDATITTAPSATWSSENGNETLTKPEPATNKPSTYLPLYIEEDETEKRHDQASSAASRKQEHKQMDSSQKASPPRTGNLPTDETKSQYSLPHRSKGEVGGRSSDSIRLEESARHDIGHRESGDGNEESGSEYLSSDEVADSSENPSDFGLDYAREYILRSRQSKPTTFTANNGYLPRPPTPTTLGEAAGGYRLFIYRNDFDHPSLGKQIYDWAVFRYSGNHPLSEMAGDLWLLLITLSDNSGKAEAICPRIRNQDIREPIEDFLDSKDRLDHALQRLLDSCLEHLPTSEREKTELGNHFGVRFVETLFGRDRQLEKTERLMQKIRVWNMRFDTYVLEILNKPPYNLRTPPPARNDPYSPPKDDDIRRSSARRASPEGYKEKSRRKASREQLDDKDEPHISTSPPKFPYSPPTQNRTNSVPLASSHRPIPIGRSKTFANYGDGGELPRSDRGRHRSKHHVQPTLVEESDSEEDHERKHRSRQ
ncbi:unnamed protein product [Clonostachys rosea]|uniref:Protein kinase domain-containing protein n=1 Tax=Bionectria ochroleuca TaxID=29856 RepID=A0ABY6UH25_BIOOC|nr:unnamed protein product [Clonostachys rosea]